MIDFIPAPIAASDDVNNPERLAALDSYNILDTSPEEEFDRIVRLAAIICDAPVTLVSLIASDRVWFKANVGFQGSQTALDTTLCTHALTASDIVVIPDLTADPDTKTNPLVVSEPGVRFYAGAPLRTSQGHVLGSLCVIDHRPRPDGLTRQQSAALRILADQVMAQLELHRAVTSRDRALAHRRQIERRLGEVHARLQISEAQWRGLFERMTEGLVIGEVVRDAAGQAIDWRYLAVNEAWGKLVGIDPAKATGKTVREVIPGIEDAWVNEFVQVVETGQPAMFTRSVGSLERWYEGRAFPLDGDRFAVLFMEITERIRADQRRNALLEIADQLRNLSTVEDITRTAAGVVGRALGVTRAGFGLLDATGEYIMIEPDWTAPGISSIAGRHRFEDWGDIRQEMLLGEPLVIQDAKTDPRTSVDRDRWVTAEIRSLVNIPIQEHGRTVALLIVHDKAPRQWDAETIGFLRSVADRLTAGVARLRAEAEQRLLNQELSHRMKNMMAMVQAIAGQTLKGIEPPEAFVTFQQRLLALSSAHNVLLQKNWSTAPIHDVVEAALQPLGVLDRFAFSGPFVTLSSRVSLSLSLLVHEMATNATKYGSLTTETGRVAVTWHVDAEEDGLIFKWQETGGPPAVQPSRKGFGSRLIRAGLTGTGSVELRYLPTGFQAEMRARLDQVQAT